MYKSLISILAVCLFLLFIGIPCVSVSRADQSAGLSDWITHQLPDGGSIKLPPGWTIVQIDYPIARERKGEDIQYKQRLLNAKGVHNGVVCSVKIFRTWKETPSGEILAERNPSSYVKERAQQIFDELIKSGPFNEHRSLQATTIGSNVMWRYSVTANQQSSRFDQTIFYKEGIFFHASAAYTRTEENWGSSTFDRILRTWITGAVRSSDLLESNDQENNANKWRSCELDGNSTIWIPALWKCIVTNSDVDKELLDEDLFLCSQTLLNIRPNLYPDDTSVVGIIRIFGTNSRTGKQEFIGQEELGDFDEIMLVLMQSLMSTSNMKLTDPARRNIGSKLTISRRGKLDVKGFGMVCTTYTFIERNNVYMVFASCPRQGGLLDSQLEKVIELWDFSEGARKKSSIPIVLGDTGRLDNSQNYYNPQWHFSLTVPSGWEEIPKEAVEEYCRIMQKAGFMEKSVVWDAVFQVNGATHFTYPYVIVHGRSGTLRQSEIGELQKAISKHKMPSETADRYKYFAQNFQVGQSFYDESKAILFTMMQLEVANVGTVKGLVATIFGKTDTVSMTLYATQKNFERDAVMFYKMMDTFVFDLGYSYPKSDSK